MTTEPNPSSTKLWEQPAGALIFDRDGTIVDNLRFHDDAW